MVWLDQNNLLVGSSKLQSLLDSENVKYKLCIPEKVKEFEDTVIIIVSMWPKNGDLTFHYPDFNKWEKEANFIYVDAVRDIVSKDVVLNSPRGEYIVLEQTSIQQLVKSLSSLDNQNTFTKLYWLNQIKDISI